MARKARERGARTEVVNPYTVFLRDGWRCQLCGCRTPGTLRGTYKPNAPELDHIVPLALGGDHTYANTQCACRQCNISKGASVRGQFKLSLYESTGCGGA
jgi:5-methylcytosine-specific restriction endonuclease McrA